MVGTFTDITVRKEAQAALQRSQERLELLHEIDKAILAAVSPTDIAESVIKRIRQYAGCQRMIITFFPEDETELEILAFDADQSFILADPADNTIDPYRDVLAALERGETYFSTDFETRGANAKRLAELGLRESVFIPLQVQAQLIGAISFSYSAQGQFTEEREELAREVADQLAIAIQQSRLHNQIQRHADELEQRVADRTQELTALYEVSAVASSSLDLDTTLAKVTQRFIEAVHADSGGIHLLDEDNTNLLLAYSQGVPASLVELVESVPLGSGRLSETLQRGESIYIPDLMQDPIVNLNLNEPLSMISIPIRASGQNLGVISVLGKPGRIEFTNEEFALCASLAEQAALVVESARLREQSERAAAIEERQRLARELHDAVSQTLFSASVIAQTLDRFWDRNPEMVKQNLVELQKLTRGALAEMRNLLLELRPAAIEHTHMVDLLQQLADGFAGRTSAEIEVNISGREQLPLDVRATFFRVAQEALNNIVKHARANSVIIDFDSQEKQGRLVIADDGRGFDLTESSSGHHGLTIMRERAESIAAELLITSRPGEGTRIELLWSNNGRESHDST